MQLTPGLLRRALVAGAAVIGTFQVALAAGAPLGALAWGGSHPGVLPSELRAASAASAVGWTAVAVAVARIDLPARPRARTGLNLASPSEPERLVWTPVSVGIALTAWTLRQSAVRRPDHTALTS